MSFSAAFATVVVSLATGVMASFMFAVFMERWLGVSIRIVNLASKFVPKDEREDFIKECLGDLSYYENVGPVAVVMRSSGLLFAGVRIGFTGRLLPSVPRATTSSSKRISRMVSFGDAGVVAGGAGVVAGVVTAFTAVAVGGVGGVVAGVVAGVVVVGVGGVVAFAGGIVRRTKFP